LQPVEKIKLGTVVCLIKRFFRHKKFPPISLENSSHLVLSASRQYCVPSPTAACTLAVALLGDLLQLLWGSALLPLVGEEGVPGLVTLA
jgi:hypothetical protein